VKCVVNHYHCHVALDHSLASGSVEYLVVKYLVTEKICSVVVIASGGSYWIVTSWKDWNWEFMCWIWSSLVDSRCLCSTISSGSTFLLKDACVCCSND